MPKLIDPIDEMPEADKKDKAKVRTARGKAKGWKLPKTKAAKKQEQDERMAQWLAENPSVTTW